MAAPRLNEPLPYYRWYVRDHRGNRGVQALTGPEEGLLRALLDEQWLEGFIPDDIQRLAKISRYSVSAVSRAWPKLRAFFVPLDGLDSHLLVNAKLERQRTEADAVRVKRAIAGAQGGKAKAIASKCQQMVYSIAVAEQSSSTDAGTLASAPKGRASAAPSAVDDNGVCKACGGVNVHVGKCGVGKAQRMAREAQHA